MSQGCDSETVFFIVGRCGKNPQAINFLINMNIKKTNMTTQDLINEVRQWGADKQITGENGKANSLTQYLKLHEECGELLAGLVNQDKAETIDAIGDCGVVLILLAELEGIAFEDCLESAYNVISKRTGRIENGVFIKD